MIIAQISDTHIALDTPDALKRSVQSADLSDPTMEETFIRIIQRFDTANGRE